MHTKPITAREVVAEVTRRRLLAVQRTGELRWRLAVARAQRQA